MKLLCCFVILCWFCFAVTVRSEPTPCTTPNGENAHCTSLFSCPILKNAVSQADPIVQKFLEASTLACGNGGLTVCCGTFGNFTESKNVSQEKEEPPKETKKEYALRKLLPTTKYCGMQHTDDYVYNETKTSVNEFPWLLQIYYYIPRRRGKGRVGAASRDITYKCTGVLISNQYALTLSNCTGPRMTAVLAIHNERRGVHCDDTPYGKDCADTIKVNVVEQIPFPNGSFLLLRLQEGVEYNDFVRPICLPLNETIRPKVNHTVITSGWGETKDVFARFLCGPNNATRPKDTLSDLCSNINDTSGGRYDWLDDNRYIKKRIKQTIIKNEACNKDNSSVSDICTKLQDENDHICKEDKGGPIMYRYGVKNWYVEGIVDVSDCVKDNVHSWRITSELVDWILENLKDS